MRPDFFFDIRVKAAPAIGPGALTALPVMTRAMTVLHGIIRNKQLPVALAFPRMQEGLRRHPGNVIRVFGESLEQLQLVSDDVTRNARLAQYVHCHFPRSVPRSFAGPWMEYRRFRIPGAGALRNSLRLARLERGESLPYFRLASKDTGQIFSLHVLPLQAQVVPQYRDTLDCAPDSYGLSSESKAFALPVIR